MAATNQPKVYTSRILFALKDEQKAQAENNAGGSNETVAAYLRRLIKEDTAKLERHKRMVDVAAVARQTPRHKESEKE